jgi:hypothetical protein
MKSTEKMKRALKLLLYGLLIVVVAGCKDDDPIPAEATLESSSDQLVNGVYKGVIGATDHKGRLTIHIEGAVPAGVKSLQIVRNYLNEGGPQANTIGDFNGLADEQEIDMDFVYPVQVSDLQAETQLVAVLIDNRDRELTIELAQVRAYWPLDLTSSMILDSDTEPGVENYTHYLTIQNMGNEANGLPKIDPQSTNMVSLDASDEYSKVQLIYDYDVSLKGGVPVGSYLCSPFHATTSNPDLVDFFTIKNQTVLKIIPYASLTSVENTQLENIGANDVAFLMTLFDKYQPGVTTERVTFNGAQGDIAFVLFKTYNGKIGLIKDHELTEETSASIQFDFWIML